jgi:hypothetical protein
MDQEEINIHKDKIDGMSQYAMAHAWRFHPAGHMYFNTYDYPELANHFAESFKKKGGMTPEISKALGWGK